MSDENSIVILAAGKGTRLKLDMAKALLPFGSEKLIDPIIKSSQLIGKITIILGHKGEQVESYLKEKYPNLELNFVWQKEQLGTGHAIQEYFKQYAKAQSYKNTIIMCADTPLVSNDILNNLILAKENDSVDAICVSFKEINPTGYGRIKRYDQGLEIIEEKDANQEDRLITEVNSGLYAFDSSFLCKHVQGLKSTNKSNEFYLTDVFKKNANVKSLIIDDGVLLKGVNNLYQLSELEELYRYRSMKELQLKGVLIKDLKNTYIYTDKIKSGTIIEPNVCIDATSTIEEEVYIESGCIIKNSFIEKGAHIKANSYIVDSKVGEFVKIGPMAHLRPGSTIMSGCKIGNFVEIKKSQIQNNVSISHLSYVGDAHIGKNTNIGCGFITCNYDGQDKHQTVIGEECFIGSDSQLIAPVNIGDKAYIASGSTINKDIPDGAFAIARQRQVTKLDMAKRFIKMKKKQ